MAIPRIISSIIKRSIANTSGPLGITKGMARKLTRSIIRQTVRARPGFNDQEGLLKSLRVQGVRVTGTVYRRIFRSIRGETRTKDIQLELDDYNPISEARSAPSTTFIPRKYQVFVGRIKPGSKPDEGPEIVASYFTDTEHSKNDAVAEAKKRAEPGSDSSTQLTGPIFQVLTTKRNPLILFI